MVTHLTTPGISECQWLAYPFISVPPFFFLLSLFSFRFQKFFSLPGGFLSLLQHTHTHTHGMNGHRHTQMNEHTNTHQAHWKNRHVFCTVGGKGRETKTKRDITHSFSSTCLGLWSWKWQKPAYDTSFFHPCLALTKKPTISCPYQSQLVALFSSHQTCSF